jgi:SulP family sulfate permease
LVLGVQSVPDGLATGLLAGVNPLAGLYAYVFGTFSGALFTSSAFMAVQGTGAMSVVVADVPAVHNSSHPAASLFTLSVLTGAVMLVAGFLRLGSALRFVSTAVMVGFLSAVGVNIVLGQLANFTGYAAQGSNRVTRAFDTLIHPGELHLQTVAVGATTIAVLLFLEHRGSVHWDWWSPSSLLRLSWPSSDGRVLPRSTTSVLCPARFLGRSFRSCGSFLRS